MDRTNHNCKRLSILTKELNIAIYADFDEFKNALIETDAREYSRLTPTEYGALAINKKQDIYVFINTKLNDMEYNSTLVHECVHLKQLYCKMIVEKNPGTEIEAYIVETFYSHLKPRFDKIRMAEPTWTADTNGGHHAKPNTVNYLFGSISKEKAAGPEC